MYEEGDITVLYKRILKLLKKHFQNHFALYFALFCAFILGNIFGSVFLKKISYDTKMSIFTFFHPFLKGINIYTKTMTFRSLFLYNSFMLLFMVLLGLFNLGYIFIPILITFIGASVGFRVGFLVSYFKFKGLWMSIIGIYPQYLFFLISFLGVGSLSMSLSENPFKFSNKTRLTQKIFTNREYYILFCFFLSFSFLGIITEIFCSPILKFILKDVVL